MAFAVTTTNTDITITDNTTYFDVDYTKINNQHNQCMVYIDYTKDAETHIDIKIARYDNLIGDWFYEPVEDATGIVTIRNLRLESSMKICIPAQIGKNEEYLRIEITPQTTVSSGDVVIEIHENILGGV